MRATRLLTVLGVVALALTATQAAQAAPRPRDDEQISYRDFAGPALDRGQAEGVSARGGALRITRPIGTLSHTEPELGTTRSYDYGRWTSPYVRPGFDATELIASWNARTPAGTWLEVQAQGRTAAHAETTWYTMGRWASGDGDIKRTSVDGQDDANGAVYTDTLSMKSGAALTGYRLRVTLYRATGTAATPSLSTIGAMTSAVPDRFEVQTTKPGRARGIELKVPAYAQNLHKGDFPEYGGGGEAWCSPTSTAMVLSYYGRGPSEADLAWIPKSIPDRQVDYAARYTYDHAYDGTGNWPFNTAYAATFGLRGHITRLHSLLDVEDYIARGVPVITSQSFLASELDGAGYGTSGHIMVVVGFTKDGDVIANDPASSDNSRVRNVYKRDQFERIWQRTQRHLADGSVGSGPGGVAYIIER